MEALLARLRPLAGCVSDQPFATTGLRAGGVSFSFLPFVRVVQLQRTDGLGRLLFEARLDYSIDGVDTEFLITLAGYRFAVQEPDGREILAFHWHPDGPSPIRHPHLHLSSRIPEIRLGRAESVLSLSDLHVPTGPVSFPAAIAFVIEELGVSPRRFDWKRVVDRSEATSREGS